MNAIITRNNTKIVKKYYARDLDTDDKGRYVLDVTELAAAQQTDKVAFQIVNGAERGKSPKSAGRS